ncbi:MAG: TlpA disulfide reductase family protein [Terriglobia bacterium]
MSYRGFQMRLPALILFAAVAFAQKAPEPAAAAALTEQEELSKALGEAGNSGADITRALEYHLRKYPETAQRPAIEKALAQWAIEGNDRARTILYGERVLKAEPDNELQLIDRVIRSLLDQAELEQAKPLKDTSETAKKALVYARRYESQIEAMRTRAAEGHMSPGQWTEQVDRNLTRSLVLKARAFGLSGQTDDAIKTATTAWTTMPASEAAHELARWLEKAGRREEAIEYYAAAFSIEDSAATEAGRDADRRRAGELYTAIHGSEKGLGDVFLAAYDRTRTLNRERVARLKAGDPNFDAVEIADFTLPRSDGAKPLALASLKGKTVVLDFWATWCGPCRAQHPLIENVKKNFKDGDVVFLAVDADDDHSLVAPFLKENHWDTDVYFDGGMGRTLKISSIPTTIVLDREGRVSSRMTGFIPELFEDMLKQRIEETRTN